MANFDGQDDFFDSREIIERINEMELEYGPEDGDSIDTIHTEKMDEEEREEYEALIALRDEAEGDIPDFEYGETFIHEDYFTEYAMQTLEDIGYLPKDRPEFIVIDEDETADNMKEDYTEFTFRGSTYYAR